MLDHYIWGDATRISPEAPVPVIDIARDTWTGGRRGQRRPNIAGPGAGCTPFRASVGEDEAGARLRAILTEKGVEGRGLAGRG